MKFLNLNEIANDLLKNIEVLDEGFFDIKNLCETGGVEEIKDEVAFLECFVQEIKDIAKDLKDIRLELIKD